MAKIDLDWASAVFEQTNGRKPWKMEREILAQIIISTGMIVGPEDFSRAWIHFYNPPIPADEVKWDEFALMGCLDGAQ